MAHRYLQIGIVFLLLLQGFCDTATIFLPCCRVAVKAVSLDDAHKAVCHCRNCLGGKRCCCLKAHTTADAIQMRAVCDTPDEVQLATSPAPRIAPPFYPIISEQQTRPLPPIGRPMVCSSLTGRTPEPAIKPPCFLS